MKNKGKLFMILVIVGTILNGCQLGTEKNIITENTTVSDVTITIHQTKLLSSKKALATYPQFVPLTGSYMYIITELTLENNSAESLNNFYNIMLYDEYGESSFAKYVEGNTDEFFDINLEMLPHTSRTGKIVWILKNDVKKLILKYAPFPLKQPTQIIIQIKK